MNFELQSSETKDIAAALAKAQGAIENAHKDSKNPHFKSSFASLAAVINAVSAELSKNGLAVVQSIMPIGDKDMALVTTLTHTSGQWFRSYIPLILSKDDMQGLGSAITYARRYALSAIVGITQEDDDGNVASEKPKAQVSAVPESKPREAVIRQREKCECGGKLMDDKFNKGAKYCASCKTKYPAGA